MSDTANAASRCQADSVDFGTTAIAIWTPGRVILAADGKVTRRNDPATTSYAMCKTRVVGSRAVTAAGFFRRPRVGYDVWPMLEAILSTSDTMRTIDARVRTEVGPPLADALADARQADPTGFARDFVFDYLGIAFAGIEDGQLGLRTAHFSHDDAGGISYSVGQYPRPADAFDAGAIGIHLMGEHSVIDREYPDARLVPLLRKDLVEAARVLVELEIQRTPEKVGPPLSVVEVTPGGPRWIVSGACR